MSPPLGQFDHHGAVRHHLQRHRHGVNFSLACLRRFWRGFHHQQRPAPNHVGRNGHTHNHTGGVGVPKLNQLHLVEGWTERIVYTIFADSSEVVLTGMTVTLLLYKSSAMTTPFAYAGVSGIETAAVGTVYFDPASTDLVQGRYFARWKVTDAAGKVAFFRIGSRSSG